MLNIFSGCSNLASITIGSGVTSIGNGTFRSCSKLTSITIEATTPPTLGSGVFDMIASGFKIYVPNVNTYYYANGWRNYRSSLSAIS